MSKVRVLSWNLNNRVGLNQFRADAADAAASIKADLCVFTEFYPGAHLEIFTETLKSNGYRHFVLSQEVKSRANRVLIASRIPIIKNEPSFSSFCDDQLRSNTAICFVPDFNLNVIGIRLPWYKDRKLIFSAWDWVVQEAEKYTQKSTLLIGDFNVGFEGAASRGGDHLRHLLASNWSTCEPISESFSFFGHNGKKSKIDHALVSRRCTLKSVEYVTQTKDFSFAGCPSSNGFRQMG